MESIDLEMGDLFEDQNEDIEEITAPPPFPELEDNPMNDMATETQEDEEGEDGHDLSKLKNIKAGAAKRVVKRPQPKMDSTRLTSDKGIPLLPNLFKDVKFKGRGHEGEDLRRMMQILEHWGHRLFPKMPFDELLERCERLGAKKEVQTCVKKIRSDMPLMDDDFVSRNYDSGDEDDSKNKKAADEVEDMDAEEAFDEMMRQEAAKKQTAMESLPPHLSDGAVSPVRQNNRPLSTPSSKSMTCEQLARMERNKQLAKERRMSKLKNKDSAPQSDQQQQHVEENQSNPSTNMSESVQKPAGEDNADTSIDPTKSQTFEDLADDDDDFPTENEILFSCGDVLKNQQVEEKNSVTEVNDKEASLEKPQTGTDQQTEEEILASLEEDENAINDIQSSIPKSSADNENEETEHKNRATLKDTTNVDLETGVVV
ncbi:TIMELESS-interacting protein isoform X2 [Lingula anatina]|uniref:TIMELESS-interacting protein n=1 Tax=Lingula anatina TaxID=7574 RepID=A0A1S3K490_LINAN|nr:TIMELESS-interacting protein isoform X2 [Lingula anatina]|eukprot:XP_013417445.1 TIMELESS-interacting protein isoform X2 [Lingula anatina]